MNNEVFNISQRWIYRNARPLDLARWQYHFENGTQENVLKALAAYQNNDGGFGFALEADSWNPNSSPIQTWNAVEIIREIDLADRNHPIVQGILQYLNSGKDFVNGKWLNTVATNDDYPHAFWWNYSIESDYNPTANLCGFIIKYANKESDLYSKSLDVVKMAVDSFMNEDEIGDGHLILCYLRLKQFCEEAGLTDLFNLEIYHAKLLRHIKFILSNMQLEWCCDGVAIEFIKTYRHNLNLIADEDIVEKISRHLITSQQHDGTWDIPWQWNNYQEQWAISKNWWKAYGIIINSIFLKQFGYIQ